MGFSWVFERIVTEIPDSPESYVNLALAQARRAGRDLAARRAADLARQARPLTEAERAETATRWAADLARWAAADQAAQA